MVYWQKWRDVLYCAVLSCPLGRHRLKNQRSWSLEAFLGRLKCKLAAGLKVDAFCNRSFNGDRPTQTHSRHTQSHADPSRARQARSGPSDPRSLPDPTDPPSEQASTTHPTITTTSPPASQPRTARAAREPAESQPHASVQLARRAPSIPVFSATPQGGAPTGGASDTHTHSTLTHTHSHTHSFTHSHRRGEMEGGAGRSQRPVALREHPGSSQAVPLSVAHRVGAPPP